MVSRSSSCTRRFWRSSDSCEPFSGVLGKTKRCTRCKRPWCVEPMDGIFPWVSESITTRATACIRSEIPQLLWIRQQLCPERMFTLYETLRQEEITSVILRERKYHAP